MDLSRLNTLIGSMLLAFSPFPSVGNYVASMLILLAVRPEYVANLIQDYY
jgi:hypothetical protein